MCALEWLEPPGYLGFGKLEWLPAQVPGHVHTDLVAAGVIGDPFVGLQELGCQWVDETTWVYETSFDFEPDDTLPVRSLRFEGLDSICIVHLNGAEIGRHDNMFVPLEIEVTRVLRPGLNCLRVTFLPALAEAKARRQSYFRAQGLQADLVRFEERAFVRKAPYMFGWDWGPRLISAGIWKPVHLLAFQKRIVGVDVEQTVEASGDVLMACHARLSGEGLVVHVLKWSASESIVLHDAAEVRLSKPSLWWPRGLGVAHLYELHTYLLPAGDIGEAIEESTLLARAYDVHRLRLGFRRVEVLSEPDQWGESFQLSVNGCPMFCLGANWIPDHSFPSAVSRERLTKQLDNAVAMNMNLLRVWGGGVYESDDFYELCDERGLLVWQDFPFACSYSPDDEDAIAVIESEALVNVRRLRHHASLALWCGNNENRMMFEAKWDDARRHPSRCIGERIWESALPNLLARLDPSRPYIPTSPHSPASALANSDSTGDQHNWDVWHGRGDWTRYAESRARFASEYGFASAPSPQAWDVMCPSGWERYPVDHPIARWHDKTRKGYDVFRGLVELHYAPACNLAEWTYYSQLNQRDAMRAALEHYRRSDFCRGSLIWQFNDCWPAQSWSLLDCVAEFKAAAYELRRLHAEVLCGVELEPPVSSHRGRHAQVWIAMHNSTTARVVEVEVAVRDVVTGHEFVLRKECALIRPGEVRYVFELEVGDFDPRQTILWLCYDGFVSHRLLCEPKELTVLSPQFTAVQRGAELELSADRPCVDVYVRAGGSRLSANFMNFPTAGSRTLVVHGECRTLQLRTLAGEVTIPVTI